MYPVQSVKDVLVVHNGTDVTALPPEKRNIAQVFQFPVLYDTMTVYENLAFPLRNRGLEKDAIHRRVQEIADILDLTPFLKQKAYGLAADAKQKISLGRGLVRSDVAAILFDEPLTVIDPHLKWHLRRKLKEIHEQLKLTLIYVTHDQMEALTFAEKVVVMYEGEIVQTGTPEDLFENPEHKFVGYFIGSPGMNFLSCRLEGNIAYVNGLGIKLGKQTANAAQKTAGKLEIGIRPKYLEISPRPVENALPAHVKSFEDLGSYKIAAILLDEKTLYARLPEDAPLAAGNVWIVFPPEKTKLYADGRLVK
ncbi:MAG: ABC transporter ATP-binding protein [Syntrophaceae bacterium]|nr:ABC transporter ATP-binding protein [Syntrophaceae bacterium]